MESQPVMDLAAALDRFDGDQDLFLTLTGLFVERSAQALDALQAALAAQDLPVLIKEAHKLKGSAMEFVPVRLSPPSDILRNPPGRPPCRIFRQRPNRLA